MRSAASNIAAFCRRVGLRSVHDLHRWSADHREDFWKEMIATLGIRFQAGPQGVVDLSRGAEQPRWLPGARMNIAESCFQARARHTAPSCTSAKAARSRSSRWTSSTSLSNRFANALASLGLPADASVAIAMPMTVEAVAAYLGVVKAGYAVASIADSFAPDEIATRLRISSATIAVTQDVVLRGGKTLPMYQKVVDAGAERVDRRSGRPQACR